MSWRNMLVVVLVVGVAALAWGMDVNPPVAVTAQKIDRTKIVGRISSFDAAGFTYEDVKKESHTVKWDELDAANTFSVYEKLLARETRPEVWIALGKRLLQMKNGQKPAERAFARAVRLDPTLKEQVEALKRGEGAATQPGEEAANTTTQPGATTQPAGAPGARRDKGPKLEANPRLTEWPKISDSEQLDAVKELKEFGEKARAVTPNLALYETKFFLFYSDLPTHETDKWAGLLDRMYERLCETFDLVKTDNIWRGKALVLVFSKEEDYQKFQQQVHRTDAAGSDGMCHGFGNGDVHIAFYRQPNDSDFSHLLVHESVHGFLHRFRSPKHVPSWANEGLAEWIAEQLVPRQGIAQSELARARGELQNHKSLGDFFTAQQIADWQYPIARTMTAFMIRQNRRGYVSFIQGIKDGEAPAESLKKNFGASKDQLALAFAQQMGISGMKVQAGEGAATGTTRPTGGGGAAGRTVEGGGRRY